MAPYCYLDDAHPTPSLYGPTAVEKAVVAMWERRMEIEGFAAVMEGVRNAAAAYNLHQACPKRIDIP